MRWTQAYAALLCTVVLCAVCAGTGAAFGARQGSHHGSHHESRDQDSAPAAHANAFWLGYTAAQFERRVDGTTVYDYIAARARHAHRSARLAITSGVDHVADYAGQVHPTYRLLREAHRLGYHVFFVTGSARGRALRLLRRDGYRGLFEHLAHCAGDDETVSRCKAALRERLVRHGYRLVVNIGAHEPAWRYGPQAERTIRLRY